MIHSFGWAGIHLAAAFQIAPVLDPQVTDLRRW